MCGIGGIYNIVSEGIVSREHMLDALTRLNQTQIHRGPDDGGHWLASDGRVGFSHRRLSIIDMSSAGHQPMCNEDGTIWLTYNGEIYNFQSLRAELENLGHTFHSHTDTEVVIHAYEEWGPDSFLRFRGMFAFALWDGRLQRLYLVKDRFGIKPLYYFLDQDKLTFASEVRALAASGVFIPELNHDALVAFLLLGFVPIPLTTLKKVQALPAGHYLVVENGQGRLVKYFDIWTHSAREKTALSSQALLSLLRESVELHLISDAPIGVFLSGGIDSSALVALGANAHKSRLTTLSITFAEAAYSEERYQRLIAERYRTDHREFQVSAEICSENLPQVFAAMDQPTIDGINSYFVALMAKRAGLKAVLSGTGGDEVFCGYPHFHRTGLLALLPRFSTLVRFTPQAAFQALPDRWRKLAFLGLRGTWGVYLALRGLFTPLEVARLTGDTLAHVQAVARSLDPGAPGGHPIDRLSRYEIHGYLQSQLLKDIDMMSMAHSVEVRVPFLDPVLVSAVLASPPESRVDTTTPKPLLVKALGELLPSELTHRHKMGFTFPFAEWLKVEPIEHYRFGAFSREMTEKLFTDFLAGRIHWSRPWALFVLTNTLRL